MSLLVQIQQEPALVDGEVIEIGDTARIPNATAIAWKKKGRCIDANDQAHLKEAEMRAHRRKHAEAEIEKRNKGNNKGRR
jgi:hypothetical protein